MTTTANTKTLLTIKIDKKLKKRAEETAAAFGLPLGTMVNSLLRETVETGRLELNIAPYPSARLRKAISEAEREYVQGKLKVYTSAKELVKELSS